MPNILPLCLSDGTSHDTPHGLPLPFLFRFASVFPQEKKESFWCSNTLLGAYSLWFSLQPFPWACQMDAPFLQVAAWALVAIPKAIPIHGIWSSCLALGPSKHWNTAHGEGAGGKAQSDRFKMHWTIVHMLYPCLCSCLWTLWEEEKILSNSASIN